MQTTLQKAPGPAQNPQPFSCGLQWVLHNYSMSPVMSQHSRVRGTNIVSDKIKHQEQRDVENITAASCVSVVASTSSKAKVRVPSCGIKYI